MLQFLFWPQEGSKSKLFRLLSIKKQPEESLSPLDLPEILFRHKGLNSWLTLGGICFGTGVYAICFLNATMSLCPFFLLLFCLVLSYCGIWLIKTLIFPKWCEKKWPTFHQTLLTQCFVWCWMWYWCNYYSQPQTYGHTLWVINTSEPLFCPSSCNIRNNLRHLYSPPWKTFCACGFPSSIQTTGPIPKITALAHTHASAVLRPIVSLRSCVTDP